MIQEVERKGKEGTQGSLWNRTKLRCPETFRFQPRHHPTVPDGQDWQDPRDTEQWFSPFYRWKNQGLQWGKGLPEFTGCQQQSWT